MGTFPFVGATDGFFENVVRDILDMVGEVLGKRCDNILSGVRVSPAVALGEGLLLGYGEVLLGDGFVVGEG